MQVPVVARREHDARSHAVATVVAWLAVLIPSSARAQEPAPPLPALPVPSTDSPTPPPVASTPPTEAPPPVAKPSPPSPQPGSDVIYRTDGTALRGTVTEVVPGVEVRIQTVDGQNVAVPRHDIMRVERRRPPDDASELGRPDRSTTWVHLNGPDVAELQRYDGNGGGWLTVCTMPCDSLLPSGLQYRVTGPGLRPSEPFSLHGEYGAYDSVTVHGASRAGFVTGIVAIVAGPSALLLTGLIVLGESSLGGGAARGSSAAVLDVAAVGGLASLALGLGLLFANGSTGVAQSVPDPNSAGPTPGPYAAGPEQRSPSALWMGEKKEDALPRSLTLPLLGGRF